MSYATVLATALAVLAAAPGDFHSIADISCPDGATGCRLELPSWVAGLQPSTGDGRAWAVFTERGEPLPWKDATDSVAPPETTWTDLPLLPLADPASGQAPEQLSVTATEGRFALRWTPQPDSVSAPEPAVRWIVDLRSFRGSVLEIVPGAGDFLGSIAIEGGDNLLGWMPRGTIPVARIDSSAFSVRRLQLVLDESRDAFLRLTWTPAEGALVVQGLRGGVVESASTAPSRRDDLGAKSRGDSGWTWDAHGRPPVVGAFVEFRRRGAFGEYLLETRTDSVQPWSVAAQAFGWHRGTKDLAFLNDTVWFTAPLRARYWRVRATGSAATLGDSARLVLRLRPDRIEFPTGGTSHLLLAVGLNPKDFDLQPRASGAIPADPVHGMVGSPRLARGESALVAAPDRRAWILGGTLGIAVLALLLFAWRLWKDALREPKREE